MTTHHIVLKLTNSDCILLIILLSVGQGAVMHRVHMVESSSYVLSLPTTSHPTLRSSDHSQCALARQTQPHHRLFAL